MARRATRWRDTLPINCTAQWVRDVYYQEMARDLTRRVLLALGMPAPAAGEAVLTTIAAPATAPAPTPDAVAAHPAPAAPPDIWEPPAVFKPYKPRQPVPPAPVSDKPAPPPMWFEDV